MGTDVKSSINSVIEDLTEMIEVAEDLTEDEEELKTLELGSVEKQFLENMESFNNLNEALQSLSSQNAKIASHKKADGGCDNSVAGAEECLAPVISGAEDEDEEAFVT